jgi:deferrochelatase/peroxidase EfeB
MLAGAALLGVGAGLDRLIASSAGGGETVTSLEDRAKRDYIAFFGTHQAGVATPAPEFLSFAAFDASGESANDLRGLLQAWTMAAVSLTKGSPYRVDGEGAHLPPADPGEAVGIPSARLTITFGLGPSMFDAEGIDRFGLRSKHPSPLASLPAFRGDSLDPSRSDGDLCVQACAEDPQVAFHAIHVLSRIAVGVATVRWTQDGFGRTSSTARSQPTPRNLMGFKDGTNNIRGDDAEAMDEHVWVQPGDGPAWMEGGTYMVVRRIKLLLDVWDATSLEGQERVIGREKLSGAPLGGEEEFDAVDLNARRDGQPVVPADSHVRLSSPDTNGGLRILRRGYSFTESAEPGSGQLDAGLFFISFQRDPRLQFVPIQRRLSESDALNRHVLHTGGAVFACPPGAKPGGFVGEGLFA